MSVAGEAEGFDAPEDESDEELELTEDEFDARWAEGQPVMVIGFAARAQLRERIEDYYTLQMSDSRSLATSAGVWGSSTSLHIADQAPLLSNA
jgi:hypothetical protein